MADWIRCVLASGLILAGLFVVLSAVLGLFRFKYVMNRMHAAGIGDTFGLFFTARGLAVSSGALSETLKLLLLVVFMWFSSPVSTHFLGQAEYYTNPHLYRKVDRAGEEEEERE